LPGYFGFNFNALHDCLRNLFWISQECVVLIHEELPSLDQESLAIYLDVLCMNCQDRSCEPEHAFQAVFPAATKVAVESALAKYPPQ